MSISGRIPRLRALFGAVLAATLGATPVLAQESDPALVKAAQEEGQVMFYGELITPTSRAIKEGFEAKYPGITMEFIYLSGAPMMNRIMSEQDNGQYLADVLALDALRLPTLKEKGYLAEYVSPQQVHYSEEWLSQPPGFWIQNHVYLGGVMYNKDMVSAEEAPKSWQDLLDPKWKGKIALVSPVANDLVFYMFAGLVRDMGEDEAFKYFEALAQQAPYVFGPGGIRVSQGVQAGEFPVGIGFTGHVYTVGGGENGNMAIVPLERMYALSGPGIAVMEHAPHPNAARLFADYLNSQEVQEIISAAGYFSSYPDVDAPPSMKSLNVTKAPTPHGAEADALRQRIAKVFGL